MTEQKTKQQQEIRSLLFKRLQRVRDQHQLMICLEMRIERYQNAKTIAGKDWEKEETINDAIRSLESSLKSARQRYATAIVVTSGLLGTLDNPYQQAVMMYRYVDIITDWQEIARKMKMSKEEVVTLYNKALSELQQRMTPKKDETEE